MSSDYVPYAVAVAKARKAYPELDDAGARDVLDDLRSQGRLRVLLPTGQTITGGILGGAAIAVHGWNSSRWHEGDLSAALATLPRKKKHAGGRKPKWDWGPYEAAFREWKAVNPQVMDMAHLSFLAEEFHRRDDIVPCEKTLRRKLKQWEGQN